MLEKTDALGFWEKAREKEEKRDMNELVHMGRLEAHKKNVNRA